MRHACCIPPKAPPPHLGADALAAAAKQAELAVRAQQPEPIDAALRHCAAELQPILTNCAKSCRNWRPDRTAEAGRRG